MSVSRTGQRSPADWCRRGLRQAGRTLCDECESLPRQEEGADAARGLRHENDGERSANGHGSTSVSPPPALALASCFPAVRTRSRALSLSPVLHPALLSVGQAAPRPFRRASPRRLGSPCGLQGPPWFTGIITPAPVGWRALPLSGDAHVCLSGRQRPVEPSEAHYWAESRRGCHACRAAIAAGTCDWT